jgi:hypothetical protein
MLSSPVRNDRNSAGQNVSTEGGNVRRPCTTPVLRRTFRLTKGCNRLHHGRRPVKRRRLLESGAKE